MHDQIRKDSAVEFEFMILLHETPTQVRKHIHTVPTSTKRETV